MPKGIYLHKPQSIATKLKRSLAMRGEKHFFYGKHHSQETCNKISTSKKGIPNFKLKGKKLSEEHKVRLRVPRPGAGIYLHKPHLSEEHKKKIGIAIKKRIADGTHNFSKNIGQKLSLEQRKKIGINKRGSSHWNWKGGKSNIGKLFKNRVEWKIWREAVFKRDNYTCQECNVEGAYLEPHHIIPLRVDLTKAFNVNNGITLCRPCHKKTLGKEEGLVEKYSTILETRVGLFP